MASVPPFVCHTLPNAPPPPVPRDRKAILYFAPAVLPSGSKLSLFLGNVGVGVAKFFGECVAAALADAPRLGRRSMMVYGNAGVVLGLGAFGALALARHENNALMICALSWVMLAFSLGPGPFTTVFVSESAPIRIRAPASAIACFLNRATSACVALSFLPLQAAIGSAAPIFFGCVRRVGRVGPGCAISIGGRAVNHTWCSLARAPRTGTRRSARRAPSSTRARCPTRWGAASKTSSSSESSSAVPPRPPPWLLALTARTRRAWSLWRGMSRGETGPSHKPHRVIALRAQASAAQRSEDTPASRKLCLASGGFGSGQNQL